MGIFHKTLNDAKKAAEEDNFMRVVQILEEHSNLGVMTSELNALVQLKKTILDYEQTLQRALTIAKAPPNQNTKVMLIGEIRAAKGYIESIERKISRLIPVIRSEE